MASEIKVDTISEKTAANGVTIDGALIKDSQLASTAGGGLVLLQSATASASPTFTFDNFADSSTYSGYRVVFDSVLHSADSNDLLFTFRSGGASGSDMTGTYYRYFNFITNSPDRDWETLHDNHYMLN